MLVDFWKPTTSLETLQSRAAMLRQIRSFFDQRNVLEVETPALSSAAISDPAIQSIAAGNRYLHTSPELAMKRLLAAGSGDIYQICKVFREGESGRNHNLEFTLLEWYRLDWNTDQLQTEVVTLIESLTKTALAVTHLSYSECFEDLLRVNPLNTSGEELRAVARSHNLDLESELSEDGWLDLLFSLVVVPTFPEDRLTIITDYPASQAALARLNPDGETAARFEVFWGQTELANGYHELLDPKEQLQRFEQDQTTRAASGLPVMPLDEHFLAALKAGLPDCAGVALGLDRLLMKITTLNHIDKVISFPVSRA